MLDPIVQGFYIGPLHWHLATSYLRSKNKWSGCCVTTWFKAWFKVFVYQFQVMAWKLSYALNYQHTRLCHAPAWRLEGDRSHAEGFNFEIISTTEGWHNLCRTGALSLPMLGHSYKMNNTQLENGPFCKIVLATFRYPLCNDLSCGIKTMIQYYKVVLFAGVGRLHACLFRCTW